MCVNLYENSDFISFFSKIEYSEPRQGDILHSQADISQIKKDIGFSADYSVKKGLTNYINYLKSLKR